MSEVHPISSTELATVDDVEANHQPIEPASVQAVEAAGVEPVKEAQKPHNPRVMSDGSLIALAESLQATEGHNKMHEVNIQYRNLSFWNTMPKKTIPTVGSSILKMFVGGGPKERVNIIKDLTGRIMPKTMTLLLGPPGCGKSTLLKALSCQLVVGSAHLDGEILYNGDSVNSGKYLVGKVASYTDEKEQHAGTLTVRETLEFAWKMTTGGHHAYGVASNEKSANVLNQDDDEQVQIDNMIKVLGLTDCANTLVGGAAVRGVSGGQKRRVTVGEMLMPPRSVRYMDAISNGLDAATTYDIVQSLKLITRSVGLTTVISLLQSAPEVFYSFEDVIVMADGQIIYHGPTTSVMDHFKGLGYHCPEIMDVADFLQEVPTPDGKRFALGRTTKDGTSPPFGTEALVKAWKDSAIFKAMLEEMDVVVRESTGKWPALYQELYPASFWYSLTHCLERETKVVMRDLAFIKGRIMQALIVGAVAGSLFSNLGLRQSQTMTGIIYFCAVFNALSGMSMVPIIFAQRAVFYKHARAYFYPAQSFVISQMIVLVPLQAIETVLFSSIIYWSAGMTKEDGGSHFFTFMFILFTFSLCVSQFYRLVATTVASPAIAQTLAGVFLILMILFCGYIIPKKNIPPGWEWFYWINPIAYVVKAALVNEFKAPDYDFLDCDGTVCERFGDQVLSSRGYPTEMVWVWYSIAVMIGLFFLFLFLTYLAMKYIRTEPVPPPPVVVDYSEGEFEDKNESAMVEIPFEPVTFAFKDIWYTIKPPKAEELNLLKGVSGYFEPGTLTALMGSSGAGKTTLLDVLSGRKNTGVIRGGLYINGKPLDVKNFRRTMGYVEQFDTLAPHDTAREAVEFSAAMRLPRETSAEARTQWVTTVLTLLELLPLENTMVGNEISGGMSFEQKKRVSIGVELAANPAILFLDEPTSGLDARAAQVVIRCIKRVAASGRSIVCTIHQPSAVIFDAFDSLLLLKRGGQTVFFGDLGEHSANLISYFERIPDVPAKVPGSNPAVWMLEVIGAGTGNTTASSVEPHAYYTQSALCAANTKRINALCPESFKTVDALDSLENGGGGGVGGVEMIAVPTEDGDSGRVIEYFSTRGGGDAHNYNATYWTQFHLLMFRFLLAYWRSPTYNFVRMNVSIVIALIFSSTYSNQKYSSDVDTVSRVALIYVTVLFMGVVGMKSVQPVILDERPAFYREQYSKLYDVKLYVLAGTLVEIPYLVVSAVMFVIPYFWIVGFDKGDVAAKFFWYWLFQGLYMAVMVFMGHLMSCGVSDTAAANVVSGLASTMISLFAGFLIRPQDFPDFWIFMYWLNPLHYAIEGLTVTQFNRDDTLITLTGESTIETANTFIQGYYTQWKYSQRGYDVLALCLFIIVFRVGAYLCLEHMRHDKR